MRIKASTLFIVVVISFLMASITGSIVCLTFYYNIQVAHHTTSNRLIHNVTSGITYMLSSPQENFHETIDLYGEGYDSVTLTNKHWGLYSIGTVCAQSHGNVIERQFMYGYGFDKTNQVAIRLNDYARLLSIAGNTTIVGDCYLPGGAVNTNLSIEGVGYHGPSQVVKGKVNKSPLTEIILNHGVIAALQEVSTMSSFSSPTEDGDQNADSLVRSFADSTMHISYSDNRVNTVSYVEGNIVLYSNTPITLRSGQQLKDVIVIAPFVKVPSGFNSSVQIICTDSIIVEENAKLTYPSSLILLKNGSKDYSPFIKMNKNAKIYGVILAYSDLPKDDKLFIKLDKDSFVHGQVYSRGAVWLQGVIYGELIADHFILKDNKNYLLDGVIDVTKRSPHFTGSNVLPVSSQKNIIKWL